MTFRTLRWDLYLHLKYYIFKSSRLKLTLKKDRAILWVQPAALTSMQHWNMWLPSDSHTLPLILSQGMHTCACEHRDGENMSEQLENCTWLLCEQKLLTSVKCKPIGVHFLIVLCKSFLLQLKGAVLRRSRAVFRETAPMGWHHRGCLRALQHSSLLLVHYTDPSHSP